MMATRKSVFLFVAIGFALYAAVYYAAEQLVYRTGKSNPFYKIATAEQSEFDWVILGASHAMPLDFADFNATIVRETGLRILNLASPGTGPLYNRFVLESFLQRHRTRGVLYIADSFAFYSRAWNEDRFADTKLVARTPFDPAVALRLAGYIRGEDVAPRVLLDYVSGFSKINNRSRFEQDVWEGERQFDRAYRSSATAVRARIAYLYPDATPAPALSRYLGALSALLDRAAEHKARVVVVKMPLPAQFRSQLPDEAKFDAELSRLVSARMLSLRDFSAGLDEPRFYFDTDHLNRGGLTEFLSRDLKAILLALPGG